jgi:hypothetical protein
VTCEGAVTEPNTGTGPTNARSTEMTLPVEADLWTVAVEVESTPLDLKYTLVVEDLEVMGIETPLGALKIAEVTVRGRMEFFVYFGSFLGRLVLTETTVMAFTLSETDSALTWGAAAMEMAPISARAIVFIGVGSGLN